MSEDNITIQYEDIQNTSADALLALSHSELFAFIRRAQREARNAQAVRDWLMWIRTEKRLRESTATTLDGDES